MRIAEPNWIYSHDATSNDPFYTNGSLWGMYGDTTPTVNPFGSQAGEAWTAGATGNSGVYVAVIDEGIDFNHPDLSANIWTNLFDPVDGIDNDGNGFVDDVHGWDFFNNNNTVYDGAPGNTTIDAHGTHVSGTIGAAGGNATGVAGVNWNVTIISAKFLGPNGGTTAGAVAALNYIVDLRQRHGLNIVATNNSWGGGGYSQALHDAIIRAAKAGVLFVAAAGNNALNNDAFPHYPANYSTLVGTSTETAASYESVVAVASLTASGSMSGFSNYGQTTVDLGAPGSGIISTTPSNTYSSFSGTSMATPHVAGAAALYQSINPGASAQQTRTAILQTATATSTSSMSGTTVTGGRLNIGFWFGAAAPAAPTGLVATAVSSSQINLSWTDNANNETGFSVERCTGASCTNFVQIASLGANTVSYQNMSLSPSTTYRYRVRAFNGGTNSGYSNIASATTQPVVDVTPPVRSNGTPSGTLPSGTTQTTLSLTSDEPATCRYATTAGTAYASMPQTFSTTVGTAHATTVTGLSNGNSYTFYVRCQDGSNNANTSDYAISFSIAGGAPPPDITTGLRGRWAFNETAGTNAADSSGNNNHGTLTNGPAWNSAGKLSGALSFDGVNDYVVLGNPASLLPGNAITLAGWMQFTNLSTNRFIISKYDGVLPQNDTFLRYQAGTGITCALGGTSVVGSAAIVTGPWYHAACTYDGSIIRLYLNGVQINTVAKTGAIGDEVGTGWLIGARTPAAPAIFMAGLLDEIRVYNRALSAADVLALFSFTGGPDVTPPVRSNGTPSGTLPSGTTQTTLSLTSDEPATCRYATTAGTAYASMPQTFSTTGGTAHATTVTGLSNGNSYTFYVRCQDGSNNANTSDYAISFSIAGGAPPPDITTGLRGRWAFNETAGTNAADSSGNNNHGTLTNGPAWNSAGKLSGALSFDGVNDYVVLGNPASLLPGNAITLAGWMQFTNLSTNRFIISKYDGVLPQNDTFLRYQAGTGITCALGGTSVVGSAAIVTGPWYHAACTYDGSIIRLYLNGVQINTVAKTGAIGDEVGTGWLIGARTPAAPAIFMAGLLDEIRVYNRALSAADVLALFSFTGP